MENVNELTALKNWVVSRFQRAKMAYNDVKNFLYMWSVVSTHKDTPEWQSFNLRYDWFRRLVYIVNLREEDMGEDEFDRNLRVVNKTLPLHQYFLRLDVHEILEPEIRHLKGYLSYEVKYYHSFQVLSFWYILKVLMLFTLVAYGLIRFA